jgi:steroid delta-isomerase-like uncharacterized protein
MDDTMTAQDNMALVRSLFDLYNSHQSDPAWLDKSLAVLAADAQLTNVPTGRTLAGSEGFKQFLLFFADGFPGSSTEITNAFATEDQVVIEFTGRGTNSGPLHMPTGDIPPTGRNTELRFCEVFQIKDGKIVSLHAYYDLMTMLQQLGLVPAMG